MTRAFVLVTAIPPTRGHLHLIQFAAELADEVRVIIGSQPGEPYVAERVDAIRRASTGMPHVTIANIHRTLPQEPHEAADFWPMWRSLLRDQGMRDGDAIVASEPYGATLAETSGGVFYPFDLERVTTPVRARLVREDPVGRFADILPEFQPVLRRRVTVLGAESTGKTTLARALAAALPGHSVPEWARSFLEQTPTPTVDVPRMHLIWRGQRALQRQATQLTDKPFIVQDTDLFATVGFWQAWQPSSLPPDLIADAVSDRSDLYLLTRSDIPFEPDPLRYGGDRRETSDAFWVELAGRHGLPLHVLASSTREDRLEEASAVAMAHFSATTSLGYARRGEH